MSNNVNGFEYEQRVIDAIRDAGIGGNITEAAGASSVHGDADFRIDSRAHLVEVKLDRGAQMGGSSVKYSKGGETLELVSPVESEVESMILNSVKSHTSQFDRLINYVAEKWDTNIDGYPFRCPKEVWTGAASNGLLVNIKIRTDVGFIANHYKAKGVDYIQIGKSGLFYLADNPANLPIPKLAGEINVEIRTARSGSVKTKSGFRIVTGSIRNQGRLKTKNNSPYTLDCPISIKKMLAQI